MWAEGISPVHVEMDWCRPCVWNSKSSASTWEQGVHVGVECAIMLERSWTV